MSNYCLWCIYLQLSDSKKVQRQRNKKSASYPKYIVGIDNSLMPFSNGHLDAHFLNASKRLT